MIDSGQRLAFLFIHIFVLRLLHPQGCGKCGKTIQPHWESIVCRFPDCGKTVEKRPEFSRKYLYLVRDFPRLFSEHLSIKAKGLKRDNKID